MKIDHSGTMDIFRNSMIARVLNPDQEPGEGFSEILGADAFRMDVVARRDAVLSNQEAVPEEMHNDDMKYIQEYGMQAYVEELQKKKIEELREKILNSMGFTEESLSAMSAEQRSAIEEMISNEIQKRLAANSLLNGDPANDNGAFLKTMMVTNNSYSFFENPSLVTTKGFKEFMADNAETEDGYDFFRSQKEEIDR